MSFKIWTFCLFVLAYSLLYQWAQMIIAIFIFLLNYFQFFHDCSHPLKLSLKYWIVIIHLMTAVLNTHCIHHLDFNVSFITFPNSQWLQLHVYFHHSINLFSLLLLWHLACCKIVFIFLSSGILCGIITTFNNNWNEYAGYNHVSILCCHRGRGLSLQAASYYCFLIDSGSWGKYPGNLANKLKNSKAINATQTS